MATVQISDELLYQAQQFAVSVGYPTPDSLIEEATRQMIKKLKADEFQRRTQQICTQMKQQGISEAEILADFEQFRQSLPEGSTNGAPNCR
jgi:molybdopterin-biosynthesis enzyme MoeA-like protein